MAMVPVEVDGVGLRHVDGVEGAGHRGHELAEDADAAVPEGRLGQAARRGPGARRGVERFHHVRQLERVVIATRHKQAAPQGSDAPPHMDLGREDKLTDTAALSLEVVIRN